MLLIGLLLLALGLFGTVLAWNYQALVAFRLLTGVGAALIPPNSVAIVSEVFPPTARGKAIGWLMSASGLSAVAGVPLVVALLAVGGWPLPFLVLGTASLSVGLLCWWKHGQDIRYSSAEITGSYPTVQFSDPSG